MTDLVDALLALGVGLGEVVEPLLEGLLGGFGGVAEREAHHHHALLLAHAQRLAQHAPKQG